MCLGAKVTRHQALHPATRFGPGFHKFPRALNELTDDRAESPMFQSDDPGGYRLDA
jgi:hypothetical protein